MIRLSSVVDDTFEPYTGGVPSPNPDYPQDVKVVKGNNTITISDGTNSENYSVNLGTLELCKIADYQDYIYKNNGKWYKKNNINKVINDGSESWGLSNTGTENWFYRLTLNTRAQSGILGLSNLFSIAQSGISSSNTVKGFSPYNINSTQLQIRIRYGIEDTLENFKTFLASNNLIVYFVLETSTDTEITDTTLIEQLEALYNAISYDNTTNITQTNADLPFILSASALMKGSV
jgi:hypothetical protein